MYILFLVDIEPGRSLDPDTDESNGSGKLRAKQSTVCIITEFLDKVSNSFL